LVFDEAAGGGAFVGWAAALFVAFAGSFVFDVADRQPQQLDHRPGCPETPLLGMVGVMSSV
jgi:hypothetical protein